MVGRPLRQSLTEKWFVFRDQDLNPHEMSLPRFETDKPTPSGWWDSEAWRKALHACVWEESLNQQTFHPGEIGKGI